MSPLATAPRALFPGLGLVASACLASTASAQIAEVPNWRVGGWEAADFEPSVAVGFFTPGLELDAVLNDAGTPRLLIAPESYLTRITLSVDANDMATRPAIPGASVDTLLTVGSGGLIESWWDAGTSAWASTTHDATTWLDARRVLVGEVDGAGELDAVALGSGARTVLVQHGTPTGFTQPISFSTVFDAYDLTLIDWNGDGDDEIAALTDWGVELYDGDGSLITSLQVTYSTLIAAAIADSGSTTERLALVIDDPVTPSREWAVFWTPLGIEGPYLLGDGLGVRHAQPVDWNGDGDEDLALLTTSAHGPRIYYNQQSEVPVGTATLDPSVYALPLVTSPTLPGDNEACLGFGDFDHDGDVDAILPLQGNWDTAPFPIPGGPSEIQIIRNDAIDENAYLGFAASGVKEFFPALPDSQLRLVYTSPTSLISASGGLDPEIEYTVYETSGLDGTLSGTAFATGSAPLTGVTFPVDLWLGQTTVEFDEVYVIRFQQVVRNAAGDILALGPAWVDTYTDDEDAFEELQGFPWVGNPIPIPSIQNGAETHSGGAGMGPNLPPTDDEVPPDDGMSMP